ncbi:PIN domain-containing protein [Candidatus Woesearchaeota archaeon]|nr:PIN domain-containing protein [Candidatus Woesearchaeota archaeon]
MAEKYYLDSSIWMDLYEDRKGYKGEPLGDFAWKLFGFIKANKSKIVISDLIIRELEMNYSVPAINGMMKPFEDLLERISIAPEERDEAEKLAEERHIPKGDALHAILARNHKLVLIARDNHFKELEDISKHHKPEDVT